MRVHNALQKLQESNRPRPPTVLTGHKTTDPTLGQRTGGLQEHCCAKQAGAAWYGMRVHNTLQKLQEFNRAMPTNCADWAQNHWAHTGSAHLHVARHTQHAAHSRCLGKQTCSVQLRILSASLHKVHAREWLTPPACPSYTATN